MHIWKFIGSEVQKNTIWKMPSKIAGKPVVVDTFRCEFCKSVAFSHRTPEEESVFPSREKSMSGSIIYDCDEVVERANQRSLNEVSYIMSS